MLIAAKWLEDELRTRLRLNPASLPTGILKFCRLHYICVFRYKPFQLEKATAEITDFSDGKHFPDKTVESLILELTAPSGARSKIIYEASPFKIVAEEKIPGANMTG
ncbi:MAG: hypothetical protein R3C26_12385 [Calditrichia bacterium]